MGQFAVEAAEEVKTCPSCGQRVRMQKTRTGLTCPLCGHKSSGHDSKEGRRMAPQPQDVTRLLTEAGRATTIEEQQRLVGAAEQARTEIAAQAAADQQLDLARTAVADRLVPGRVHEHHTAATDWIGGIDTGSDPVQAQKDMIAKGAVWYAKTAEIVKQHPDEFAAQAYGMARREAGRYGPSADVAEQAFLEHVGTLHSREVASGAISVVAAMGTAEPYSITGEPTREGLPGESTTSERAPAMRDVMNNTSGGSVSDHGWPDPLQLPQADVDAANGDSGQRKADTNHFQGSRVSSMHYAAFGIWDNNSGEYMAGGLGQQEARSTLGRWEGQHEDLDAKVAKECNDHVTHPEGECDNVRYQRPGGHYTAGAHDYDPSNPHQRPMGFDQRGQYTIGEPNEPGAPNALNGPFPDSDRGGPFTYTVNTYHVDGAGRGRHNPTDHRYFDHNPENHFVHEQAAINEHAQTHGVHPDSVVTRVNRTGDVPRNEIGGIDRRYSSKKGSTMPHYTAACPECSGCRACNGSHRVAVRTTGASGLDQIDQTVDSHDNPSATPYPTDKAFPWEMPGDSGQAIAETEQQLAERETRKGASRQQRAAMIAQQAAKAAYLRAMGGQDDSGWAGDMGAGGVRPGMQDTGNPGNTYPGNLGEPDEVYGFGGDQPNKPNLPYGHDEANDVTNNPGMNWQPGQPTQYDVGGRPNQVGQPTARRRSDQHPEVQKALAFVRHMRETLD